MNIIKHSPTRPVLLEGNNRRRINNYYYTGTGARAKKLENAVRPTRQTTTGCAIDSSGPPPELFSLVKNLRKISYCFFCLGSFFVVPVVNYSNRRSRVVSVPLLRFSFYYPNNFSTRYPATIFKCNIFSKRISEETFFLFFFFSFVVF